MSRCAGMWMIWIAPLFVTPAAFAQEEGTVGEPEVVAVDPSAEAPDDQAADEAGGHGSGRDAVAVDGRPGQAPQRGARRPGSNAGNRNRNVVLLEAFRDEVKRTLQADAETTEGIDEIFAEHIEEAVAATQDSADDRKEQAVEIRDLVAELREAQRDNDRDRVAELRDQITELRKDAAVEQTVAVEEIEAAMHELLDEEQFAKFEQISRKYESRFIRSREAGDQALQRIRTALASLELTPEQRERCRSLFIEFGRKVRQYRGDEARSLEEAAALRDAILDELDDEQAEVFENQLAELERRDGTKPKAPAPHQVRALPVQAPATGDEEVGAEHIDENPYDDDPSPE